MLISGSFHFQRMKEIEDQIDIVSICQLLILFCSFFVIFLSTDYSVIHLDQSLAVMQRRGIVMICERYSRSEYRQSCRGHPPRPPSESSPCLQLRKIIITNWISKKSYPYSFLPLFSLLLLLPQPVLRLSHEIGFNILDSFNYHLCGIYIQRDSQSFFPL